MHHIALIIILLAFSAFFSGSETALFSLSKFQIKKIGTISPVRAKYVLLLLESSRRTLATILIGNMLVNITATSIATLVAIEFFGDKGVGISIVSMTFLLLLFGEVTPKTFAIRRAESFATFCGKPLFIFSKIVWPIRKVLRLISDMILPLFTQKNTGKPYITQQELKALVAIGEKEGIIEEEEEEMIRSVFEFGERSVVEIMTPRVDIIGCSKNASSQELIEIMKASKHTKIPIYEKTIDQLIGVIYTKEFMLDPKDDFAAFIRKPLYVGEAETIDDLLVRFQSQKLYIAVVLDEFGGTSGIVTLEDILEEIVGEISDEYDKEEIPIKKEEDGSFTVIGKVSIRDVNDELELDLPMSEVTTMNGLLLLLFGRLPKKGEIIRFKGVELRVLDAKSNMITRIQINRIPSSQ